eukprot:6702542-Alexandrium_andersonii.AAC.1
MSASLVGSEMCIRDRSSAVALRWRRVERHRCGTGRLLPRPGHHLRPLLRGCLHDVCHGSSIGLAWASPHGMASGTAVAARWGRFGSVLSRPYNWLWEAVVPPLRCWAA